MSEQVLHVEAAEILPSELPAGGDEIAAERSISHAGEDQPDRLDVDDEIAQPTETMVAERPADIPEKFWDADAGALRTEMLLKSYVELERKLGTMVPMPNSDDPNSRHKLQRALGKPETADGYEISSPHEMITPDPIVNAKLHEAGLSSEQAQLVYDLAAEHLVPLVEETNREASREHERSQLALHFGGAEKWQAISPQIKTWAQANLTEEVYESLGTSSDGVIAIYHMMQAREPNVISEAAIPADKTDERQLSTMMRDPRYWRDRDPTFVAEVTAGYKQLFK